MKRTATHNQRGSAHPYWRVAVFLTIFATVALGDAGEPLDYVNCYTGTAMWRGGMWPNITRPFGMIQWSPCNTDLSGYKVCDGTPYIRGGTRLFGMTGTHKSSLCMGDYGNFSFLPQIQKIVSDPNARAAALDTNREKATPYYYSCDWNVGTGKVLKVEIAPTERCCIVQVTYPASDSSYFFVEGGRSGNSNSVTVVADSQEIRGYNTERQDSPLGPPLPNFKSHFAFRINKPFSEYGVTSGATVIAGTASRTGGRIGAWVRFPTTQGEVVKIRIGTSFISHTKALDNLRREIPAWDFDKVRTESQAIWRAALGKIAVSGGTDVQKKIFYTGMYHSLLYPRIFSEYGEYYSPFDDKIHSGVSYNDYSLWDTFRALHPLLILIAPERVGDMVKALVQMGEEGGYMPIWPNPTYTGIMIGHHAHSVIADAYIKGLRDFDANRAYAQMYKEATVPAPNDTTTRWTDRQSWTGYPECFPGLTTYMTKGYVDCKYTAECGSRTLEYAYDDFCTAQMAAAVGKQNDYQYFLGRSKNYRNIYDGSMMAAAEWTEGDAWKYTWCVMQDLTGLVDLMGLSHYNSKLDEHFSAKHNDHSNEPCHHYPYLYNYSGHPWKSQKIVRDIAKNSYGDGPSGLSGDDDCGQMSAWYIFSAMGFYPVTPGSKYYAIGSPLFDTAVLSIEKPYAPAKFRVIALNNSQTNVYVQSADLDGVPLTVPFIDHDALLKGSVLKFTMGPTPNTNWGTGGYDFMKRAMAHDATPVGNVSKSMPAQTARRVSVVATDSQRRLRFSVPPGSRSVRVVNGAGKTLLQQDVTGHTKLDIPVANSGLHILVVK